MGVGVAGRRGELAGRQRELLGIERLLDLLARSLLGGVLQIVGEPGIGKTRLLAEVAAMADERGHAVTAGRAADLEHDVPFGVFADALDAYLASLATQLSARLSPELLAELGTAFPSLARLGRDRQPAMQAERFRTHRAVRTLLEDLGRARPTVVLLDDVHWADPASQELLRHLLAYPPDAPMLLVVALRPAHAPASLSQALAAATREGKAQTVELGPLSRADAEKLMAGDGASNTGGAVPGERRQPLLPRAAQSGCRARPPGGRNLPEHRGRDGRGAARRPGGARGRARLVAIAGAVAPGGCRGGRRSLRGRHGRRRPASTRARRWP